MASKATPNKSRAYQEMSQAQLEMPESALDDRDELKEYRLGVVGYAVYATLLESGAQMQTGEEQATAAARALGDVDPEERQHQSSSAWRSALGDATVLALAEAHGRFGQPDYQRLLRDIIQGTLTAAKEAKFSYQEAVKVIFTFLMYVCPHEGRAGAIKYLAKTVAYEILLCKLSIGMPMKMAAYAMGEAIFTLAVHEVLVGRKDDAVFDPHVMLDAVNEGVWSATELIVPNSIVHLRDNGFYIVRGFSDCEERLRKGLITGSVEKVLSLPVIGWVYRPMRWMVLVAFDRLKQSPVAKKVWERLMS
ncbi:MAG: hypothetical protein H7338_23845 [Candidatus Sericytochromatia bacterium]|nr:hypothetical protein [Candidatus Sericytochromatia bacterium]